MSQVSNFDAMSDDELKQYFLSHRGDRAAFEAHLSRINQRPLRIIANADDPEFDQKVRAAIAQKLAVAQSN